MQPQSLELTIIFNILIPLVSSSALKIIHAKDIHGCLATLNYNVIVTLISVLVTTGIGY